MVLKSKLLKTSRPKSAVGGHAPEKCVTWNLSGVGEGGADVYPVKAEREDEGRSHVSHRTRTYGGNYVKLIIRTWAKSAGQRAALMFPSWRTALKQTRLFTYNVLRFPARNVPMGKKTGASTRPSVRRRLLLCSKR